MTTKTLAQTISLRRQMSIEELLGFAPQLVYLPTERTPMVSQRALAAPVQHVSDAEYAFWSTFSFGCVQALVVFGMIYSYFAR